MEYSAADAPEEKSASTTPIPRRDVLDALLDESLGEVGAKRQRTDDHADLALAAVELAPTVAVPAEPEVTIQSDINHPWVEMREMLQYQII
eukprot:243095-Lingulodinium_polyedra.AAC.1